MTRRIEDLWAQATHAVGLILDHAARVDPWLVALGTVLYMISQAVRTRGWHTILHAAYPGSGLRARDTCLAYLAGAGLNGVIPARGGDVAKLALVRRRIEGSRYSTLAATFVPETVFETLFGTGLVVWALVRGFLPVPTTSGEVPSIDVSLLISHPILSAIVIGGLVVGAVALWRLLRRTAQDFLARFRQGLVIFGSPRRFVTGVASWQALARVIRLGSLAAFMGAFALPVTVTTAVLVMAAQGGGRIIPLAPASAGLRLAMLSYGFVEVTGKVVDIAEITAFTFGVGAVLLVAGLLVSAVILAREFETLNPRAAIAKARAGLAGGGRREGPEPYLMSTGVPTGTRLYSAITFATCMRMHPCDARVPIDASSPVPWKPTPFVTPIQRAFSGLAAEPPWTVVPCSSPAHAEFGTDHVGLTCLLWMWNRPLGVG